MRCCGRHHGAIAQMHAAVASRLVLRTGVPGHLSVAGTAVTVPSDRLLVEGHEVVLVDVGHTDTDGTSVVHVPDLELVVAGDVIYNGVHMWIGESVVTGGFGP